MLYFMQCCLSLLPSQCCFRWQRVVFITKINLKLFGQDRRGWWKIWLCKKNTKVGYDTKASREAAKEVNGSDTASLDITRLLKWKPNGHQLLAITPTPSLHRPIPSSSWWTLKPRGNPTSPTPTPCRARKQSSQGRHYGVSDTEDACTEMGRDNTVFRC